ncbi:hypothetical protein MF672_046820 [Actinomadura sp. ATCC 31491]|uniref:Rpn family recombination-promoting nuclease/putative transposase n=1 Tax=Actinomadura luzonensis TaxID=2805427 RepID=A0ABT0GA40_9ACTN|nr:hypothetical protein [Actinomadura luzonensis]MCK2221268.1 hypothetical protein [Actinomadura luzonensis]
MSPTQEHEFLIELVRHRPSLVATLLTEMGVPVPSFTQARLESTDFTNCVPTEYRADSVVVLDGSKPVSGVVLEVQRQHREEKTWSWPVYLTTLRARIKCPCILLVFCPDPQEALRCAKPIEMGHPGWTLRPIVLGPQQVPMITDLEQAIAEPELTALSAIVHGSTEEGFKVLQTLHESQEHLPEEAQGYSDLVLSVLPESAVATFKEIMMVMGTFKEPRSKLFRELIDDGIAQGVEQGIAQGEAESILTVLRTRGLSVPEEAQERIRACEDRDLLLSWVAKAVTVESVDELFD